MAISSSDALEDLTLGFHQLRVTNENNSFGFNHAQNTYSSNVYTTPQVWQTTSTNDNDIHNNDINEGLSTIKREIIKTALIPEGSSFLQTVLLKENDEYRDDEYRELIFEGVYEYMFDFLIHDSATNVFGRLVEVCDNHELRLIVAKLITMDRKLFVKVICNKFGANSIKKLIKVLHKSPFVSDMTSLLVHDFRILMRNRISLNVIINCVECLSAEQNKELYEATIRDCIDLATDENGCLALCQCIGHFKQPYKDRILTEISSKARFLSQDLSGNYVVQQVLELGHPSFCSEIYKLLRGHFVMLSTKKSSSRVVEKCLLNDEGIDMVLNEFINCETLWKVARDQNGNYVIQKALDLAKGSQYYAAFVEKLNKDRHRFVNGFGKHVCHKLMNI